MQVWDTYYQIKRKGLIHTRKKKRKVTLSKMASSSPAPSSSFTTTLHLDCLSVKDIPAFIGKGAMNIKKNVKVPAWKMFSSWQKNNSQEEKKHTLFVKISEEEEKVMCEIKTSSEELLKFAVFTCKKAQQNFNTNIYRHTFYASMDHSLIPLFIGHKGKSVQTFLNRASKEAASNETCTIQAGNPFKRENKGDLRLSIESLEYFSEESDQSLEDSVNSMIEKVDQSKFLDFIGWQPSTDEYEEYVQIKMEVFSALEDLSDIKTFLSEKINDYIKFIAEKDQKRSNQRVNVEQDIDEALSTEI